jgi:hypothetical protein
MDDSTFRHVISDNSFFWSATDGLLDITGFTNYGTTTVSFTVGEHCRRHVGETVTIAGVTVGGALNNINGNRVISAISSDKRTITVTFTHGGTTPGSGADVYSGGTSRVAFTTTANALVTIASGNNVFTGNSIAYNTAASGDNTTAILVKSGSGSAQISDNTIGARYRGIVISNSGGAGIHDNVISGCFAGAVLINAAASGRSSVINGNSFDSRSSSGTGTIIIESGAMGPVITGNNISGNQHAVPAVIVGAHNAVISGNTISGGGSASGIGVRIAATANDCTVSGNLIGLHTTAGIDIVAGANRANVYGNNVNACTVGIVDAGTGSQIAPATGPAANIGA